MCIRDSAYHEQTLVARKLNGHVLVEGLSRGREEDDVRSGTGRAYLVYGLEDGWTAHEQAGPTSVDLVIGRAMPVVRPITQVMGMEIEYAASARTTEYGGRHDLFEHLGKNGDRLDDHDSVSYTHLCSCARRRE